MTTIQITLPVPDVLTGWRKLSREARWRRAANILAWIAAIAGVIYVVAFMMLAVMVSIANAMNFSGYAADGPFQLYDPLRRLAEGQALGRDFQFFNGVAIPLLYLPSFLLLGKHIFASEFSRWFVSIGLVVVSAGIFYWAAFRNWQKSLIGFATCVMIFTLVNLSVVWPSNSLINTRTTMPLIFAALYFLDYKSVKIPFIPKRAPVRELALGLCAAVAVALGTEQGMGVFLAYLIWEGRAVFRQTQATLSKLAWFAGSFVVGLLAVFTLVSAGHPIAPLAYAFIDIPKDQGWFFGTSPNVSLSWQNFIPQVTQPFLIEAYILTAVLIAALIAFRKWHIITARIANVGAIFIAYGIIVYIGPGIVGYFSEGEAIALMRVVVTMLILVAVALVFADWKLDPRWRWSKKIGLSSSLVRAVVLCTFSLLTLHFASNTLIVTKSYHVLRSLRAARAATNYSDYQDANAGWQADLNAFEPIIGRSRSVWSTYASLYQGQAGFIGPTYGGADYIIHALGPARRNSYQQQFIADRPAFVITTRPSYFPYEAWLWNNEWPFYHQLLTNYHIVAVNNAHFLWARNTGSPTPAGPWQKARVTTEGAIQLPAQPGGLTVDEVKIQYRASGLIPLTSSLPRYLLSEPNDRYNLPVSLPSYEQTWEFPVVTNDPTQRLSLKPEVSGLVPAKLTIKSVEFRQLQVTPSMTNLFTDAYCFHWQFPSGHGYWVNTATCKAQELEQ